MQCNSVALFGSLKTLKAMGVHVFIKQYYFVGVVAANVANRAVAVGRSAVCLSLYIPTGACPYL